MTDPAKLYESWLVEGSYFNRMLDCGQSGNRWHEIALSYLPPEILDEHKENLVFIALRECDACRIAPQYREREIIFLSNHLFPPPGAAEDHPTARYLFFAVLHEVAHAIRRHKSPRFDKLPNDEYKAQEREADELAYAWFNQHIAQRNNPDLQPLTPEEVAEVQKRNKELLKEMLDGV